MSNFARWSGSKSRLKLKGAALSHHKISIARKVIKRIHDLAPVHRSIRKDILRIHRLSPVQRTKLRTFGVPRAGTHMHKAAPKQPRRHRSAATYRKPRKAKG